MSEVVDQTIINRRRVVGGLVATALAVGGAFGIGEVINKGTNHADPSVAAVKQGIAHNIQTNGAPSDQHAEKGVLSYTTEQLKAMPTAEVVAHPGDSATSLGMEVDPQAYTGPISSTQVTNELNQIIENEHPGPVRIDEHDHVPIIPTS